MTGTPPPKREDESSADLSAEDAELLALISETAARSGASPPRSLRGRILSAAVPNAFTFLLARRELWIATDEVGVEARELLRDGRDLLSTRVLRMRAGSRLPQAPVSGRRAIMPIRGALRRLDDTLGPGDWVEEATRGETWVAVSESLVLELADAMPAASVRTQRGSGARWVDVAPGARVRPLSGRHGSPQEVVILEMSAASTLDAHEHDGVEELFVLAGSCTVQGQTLEVGDYHRAARHSHHDPTRTTTGCTLLVAVRDPDRLSR